MIYIDTGPKILEYLPDIKKRQTIGFDTETTGLDPLKNKVLLIQLGDEFEQYVVDVHKVGVEIFTLLEWVASTKVAVICHNAKFDYAFIKSNFDVSIQNIKCTMLGEQLLTAGRKNKVGLAPVVDKYLGIELSKGEQMSFVDMTLGQSFTENQLKYAGDDVKVLIPLYKKIQSLLDARGMRELSSLEYETLRVTADIELNGLYLDTKKWLALKDYAEEKALEAKKTLDGHFATHCQTDLFGDLDVNYNSPKQLVPLLSKITGRPLSSTSEAALKKIKHPVIKALTTYREHQKRVTTYGQDFCDKYISSVDNRIHSDFKQLGADSGRYASRNPNMNNIPSDKKYRAAFTAQDPDYRIISADFSGQELRLLAHITQEPKFLDALEKGIDLHTNSASLIFNKPYDSITKDQRTAAKSLTFGLIYGIGPMKLSANLDIDIRQAKYLMNRYFTTFPYIKKTLDVLVAEAKKNKYAYSPLDKRRRDLATFDWDNSREVAHAVNIAKNLPFQGAGASVTKYALCALSNKIHKKDLDAQIINVIHDEILVEVHKDDADETAKVVESEMIAAFNHFAPSVPMVVDAAIDTCWLH